MDAITPSTRSLPTRQPTLQWRQTRPLLGDWRILRAFLFVIVGALLLMQLSIAVMGWIVEGEWIFLPWQFVAIVAAVFTGLMLVAAIVVMRNRIVMDVTADRRGFTTVLGGGAGYWNRAAILLGILARKPGTVSAGLLAESRRRERHRWSQVTEVRSDAERRLIAMRFREGGWADLQPPAEHWQDLLTLIEQGRHRRRDNRG